jgi:4-hydroxy-tetrahydrodipicolinate synthase
MHELCAAARAMDVPQVRKINHQLMPLHRALFVEANPIPVKWALARMGKMPSLGYRLPLVALDSQHHATVEAALQDAGLLSK